MNNVDQKFLAMVTQAGITNPDLVAVANLFFHTGVAFALKEQPEKLCALVQAKDHGEFLKMFLLKSVDGITSADNIHESLNATVQDSPLKQSDLQYLSHVVRTLLNKFEDEQKVLKRAVNETWKHSDPSLPETEEIFKYHNRYKDMLRSIKKHSKRLASIQNTIKKVLKKG